MPPESQRHPFQYALVQVVPRVERHERVNAGVVVFSRPLEYLGARTQLDHALLGALDPDLDLDVVARHLDAVERVAAGDATAGPIAQMSISERFHWLVAPSSTIIQASPQHTGLCDDPAGQLDRLFAELVTRPDA